MSYVNPLFPELHPSEQCKQTNADLLKLEAEAKTRGTKLKVEAHVEGKWVGNGMEFDDAQAAVGFATDLIGRWGLAEEFRVALILPTAAEVEAKLLGNG